MRDQAAANNKTPPYLYEYYNVEGFWVLPTTGIHRSIAHILNSFIEALNMGRWLPRFLIVIIDKDIIEDVDMYDYGATKELYENVKWLIRQIDILIQRKKAEILNVRPGALYSTDPKLILVTMIHRPLQFPTGSQMGKVVTLRAKFNNSLNEVAAEYDYSILSIDSCDSECHFDLLRKLNHLGQYTFWKQLNYLLQLFNKKKIYLLPIQRRGSSLLQHRNGSGDRSNCK